jgi:hypothetical protein
VSIRGKGDAVSYFIVIVLFQFSIQWLSNVHNILNMDLERLTRYIGMQVAASSASSPQNTLPASINVTSTSTGSVETPSNVSTNSSTVLSPPTASTSSRNNYQHLLEQPTNESSSSSGTPPGKQRRVEDLLESSESDVSDVKDDDNDCMIVGTTPPPNRFSSTPPPNCFSSQYSQS